MQLNSGEIVVVKAKKHWMFFFYPGLLTFLFFMSALQAPDETSIVVIAPFVWLLYRIARYFCDEIVLTNQKVHASIGVIARDAMSIPLKRINNIGYSQGILGRIMRYGTIDFRSIGGTRYSYIANPEQFKADIEKAVDLIEQSNKKPSEI